MIRIKSLKAESVRGIPRHWDTLAINEKGLVIFGPNGSGKSSIVDALEFAMTNESSLFDRNRSGVNWNLASPHLKHGNPDITLELEDEESIVSIVPLERSSELKSEFINWLEIARSSKFVLRRYMLLDFIVADPAERYSTLEPFLNLRDYISIEQSLKGWITQLDSEIAISSTKINSLSQQIKTIFHLDPISEIEHDAILDILNSKLKELKREQCSSKDDVKVLRKQIQSELGGTEVKERLEKLGDLKGQVQRLSLPSNLMPIIDKLSEAIADYELKILKAERIVISEFLTESKNIIEQYHLDTCPVCEQSINHEQIISRLKERIEQDQLIIQAKAVVNQRIQDLRLYARPMHDAFTTFSQTWPSVLSIKFPCEYEDISIFLTDLLRILNENEISIKNLEEYPNRISSLISSNQELIKHIDKIIEDEGGGTHRGLLIDIQRMVESFAVDLEKLNEFDYEKSHLVKQKIIVDRIYFNCIEARKKTVTDILINVSELANNMYEEIHPDELISGSELSVREATRASVTLFSKFYGQIENPLLHHSESHLDTLGLCYFLALRKLDSDQKPAFKIVILDDVMHSVDAAHRSRICSLLKNYFSDHQMIITTHDIYFYDRLRETLGGSKYKYIKFTNWDIDRGPILADPLTDIDRICNDSVRESKSPEELAGASGRFMEMLLKRLTESLKISVIAKFENSHVINDLWPPLSSKLKKHKGFFSSNSELIDKIENNRWVRNACGAHYNEEPIPPTPDEISNLAKGLAQLYKSAHCEVCSKYISRQANGNWFCSCSDGGIKYIKD